VRAQQRRVVVKGGFGSKVVHGQPPTPPHPLPAAPSWASPPPRLLLAATPTVDLDLVYVPGVAPVRGPARRGRAGAAATGGAAAPATLPAEWHLQVARDPRFNDLVLDTRVPQSVMQLSTRQLAAGRYLARVSAIDADHFEGPFGPVADITVAPIAEGRRPDGSTELVLPAGLLCGLDGGAMTNMNAPLPIDRRRPHRLGCALAADLSVVAYVDLPAVTEPAVTPPPLPPPKARRPLFVAARLPGRRVGIELAIFPHLAVGGGALSTGGGVGAQLDVHLPFGPGRVAFGLRPSYERYSSSSRGPAPCAPSGITPDCPFLNSASYRYSVEDDAFLLGFPITYRLYGRNSDKRGLFLYAGVNPTLVVSHASTVAGSGLPANSDTRTRFGVGGLMGAQLPLWRGGIFFEVEGRYLPTGHPALADPTLGWFGLAIGYRIGL
jgi:hypothetical protein